jgi:hypothetical protein
MGKVVNGRPIVRVIVNVELPNWSLPHNAERLVTRRLNSHNPDLYRFGFMAQLKQNEVCGDGRIGKRQACHRQKLF